MRSFYKWLLISLTSMLTGCLPVIHSDEPLGEVAVLAPAEWNGSWLSADEKHISLGTIRVVDADHGVIIAVDRCQSEPAEPRSGELIQLRRSEKEGWFFPTWGNRGAQGKFIPRQAQPFAYIFFISRPSAHSWLWYLVAQERFKALVEKGTLPGRVNGESVTLGHLNPEHYETILSEERPLVHWRDPIISLKLPEDLDPCKKDPQGK